jgi:holo-[acyl-carrier protein] synthase
LCKNIYGIGIDIIEIKRFENLKKKLIKKIFNFHELLYLKEKNNESFAGMFALKEAIVKSLGVGFKKIPPREILIFHDENNRPFVKLILNAKNIALDKKIKKIKVSLSHEKKYLVAIAVSIL